MRFNRDKKPPTDVRVRVANGFGMPQDYSVDLRSRLVYLMVGERRDERPIRSGTRVHASAIGAALRKSR